jgi:SAM-dependent methyltransferase
MTKQKLERKSALDLAEGLQLAFAFLALLKLDVFSAMEQPVNADTLSDAYQLDPQLLKGVLEYLAIRTNLVCKTEHGFAVTKQFNAEARFVLNLYADAYAKNASRLTKLMRKPALAASTVDLVAHARAFSGEQTADGTLAAILGQLKLNHILDVGCGSGVLLREMATNDEAFVGWGLDRNAAMCKAARTQLRKAGVAKRVKVFHGDGGNLKSSIPVDVLALAQNLTACQFVNEMFRGGTSELEGWLQHTRRLLPGRMLIVSDYYGRLGQGVPAIHRETLLHDYAQLISGQGVPPPDSSAWQAIYRAAGCRLLHVIEDRVTTRFIHLLRL